MIRMLCLLLLLTGCIGDLPGTQVGQPEVAPETTGGQAFELKGRTTAVTDGDTIKVLIQNTEHRVRLEGIDCPEKSQAFGQKARQLTSKLTFGKNVRVVVSGTDRYGRKLGHVYVGRTHVNAELLRAGLAWHYKKYNKDQTLSAFEKEAKATKRGLWSDPHATPPWEFRRRKRPQAR